ncbi:MAG: hypothetical protein OES46_13640 [Gammaproteobacteria bacterium]|nr:hypothetical protein [Gammaproteobacteria bacterium]
MSTDFVFSTGKFDTRHLRGLPLPKVAQDFGSFKSLIDKFLG